MASRCSLLALLASCLNVAWVLENPGQSILPLYERLQDIFGLVEVPWFSFQI